MERVALAHGAGGPAMRKLIGEMFLDREQIDEVDESRIPGYQP